jgi:histidyl-tRNA synthetase
MMYQPENVKGFQDYLPQESQKREKIKEIVSTIYKKYGFQPIETPLIEYEELMRVNPNEEEDEAVSDRFRLKDRGGRNLGLRYEFTFQLARILKQNPNLKMPFKRFQIGDNFRDEPLRVGRTRQFTQCDIDILGDPTTYADAECLAVISEISKQLGIRVEITINNRKLTESIITSCQIQNKKQVLREIDKLEKIGEDEVKVNLRKYAESNQIIALFKLLEKDLPFFKENLFDGAEELLQLVETAKTFGVTSVFKPSLVRGFSYYTGNVFEVIKSGTKTAIMGGGRYDKTVGKYLSREIPAVGISFSLEALMGICKAEIDVKIKTEAPASAVIISISQDKEAIKLAQKIRDADISCITWFDKVGRALEYASSTKFHSQSSSGKMKSKKRNSSFAT